jgi:hypothetical protein
MSSIIHTLPDHPVRRSPGTSSNDPHAERPSHPSDHLFSLLLLAEFNEQLGPVPVFLIPREPQRPPINDFVLRAMSVDYQSGNSFL